MARDGSGHVAHPPHSPRHGVRAGIVSAHPAGLPHQSPSFIEAGRLSSVTAALLHQIRAHRPVHDRHGVPAIRRHWSGRRQELPLHDSPRLSRHGDLHGEPLPARRFPAVLQDDRPGEIHQPAAGVEGPDQPRPDHLGPSRLLLHHHILAGQRLSEHPRASGRAPASRRFRLTGHRDRARHQRDRRQRQLRYATAQSRQLPFPTPPVTLVQHEGDPLMVRLTGRRERFPRPCVRLADPGPGIRGVQGEPVVSLEDLHPDVILGRMAQLGVLLRIERRVLVAHHRPGQPRRVHPPQQDSEVVRLQVSAYESDLIPLGAEPFGQQHRLVEAVPAPHERRGRAIPGYATVRLVANPFGHRREDPLQLCISPLDGTGERGGGWRRGHDTHNGHNRREAHHQPVGERKSELHLGYSRTA